MFSSIHPYKCKWRFSHTHTHSQYVFCLRCERNHFDSFVWFGPTEGILTHTHNAYDGWAAVLSNTFIVWLSKLHLRVTNKTTTAYPLINQNNTKKRKKTKFSPFTHHWNERARTQFFRSLSTSVPRKLWEKQHEITFCSVADCTKFRFGCFSVVPIVFVVIKCCCCVPFFSLCFSSLEKKSLDLLQSSLIHSFRNKVWKRIAQSLCHCDIILLILHPTFFLLALLVFVCERKMKAQ